MVKNPLLPSRRKKVKFVDLPKSAGILDDHAVRKTLATKEGTVEHVPTVDSHIVNKKYLDDNYAKTDGANETGEIAYWDNANNKYVVSATGSNHGIYYDETNTRLGVNTSTPDKTFCLENAGTAYFRLRNTIPTPDVIFDVLPVGSSAWIQSGSNHALYFTVNDGITPSIVIAKNDDLLLGHSYTNYVKIDSNSVMSFVGTSEFHPPRVSAAPTPSISVGEMIIWRDSTNNKVYLMYNDTDEGTKKIELI